MRIIRTGTIDYFADQRLCTLLAPVFPLAVSDLGRQYYASIQGEALVDDSFLWESRDGAILAAVECDIHGGVLQRHGAPIEIRLLPTLAATDQRRILRETFGELRRIAGVRGARRITLRTSARTDPDGAIAGTLGNEGAAPMIEMRTAIDLTLSAEDLLADLRKGHRQQVRWGQNNIAMTFVDTDTPDHAAFDHFREFHAEVAGRVTRRRESWDAMYAAITRGAGDLVLGSIDGQLVSGTLILDALGTAHYASGVYDRKQFDKPLAHATLFTAMLRAKRRGNTAFDVGEQPLEQAAVGDKERSIGYFKRGFSSRLQSSMVWTLPVAATVGDADARANGTHRYSIDRLRALARKLPEHAETARLSLRPLTPGDVTDRYLGWFRDPEVTRWLEASDISREDAIAFMREGEKSGRYRIYAICDKSSGLHVGNIKLGDILFEHGVSDLVTVLGDRVYWGRGYATEAIELCKDMAFERLGLRKLSAGMYADNIASLKAYSKAGWLIEGFMHDHSLRDGKTQDRILVSCFNPTYFPVLPVLPKARADLLQLIGQPKSAPPGELPGEAREKCDAVPL